MFLGEKPVLNDNSEQPGIMITNPAQTEDDKVADIQDVIHDQRRRVSMLMGDVSRVEKLIVQRSEELEIQVLNGVVTTRQEMETYHTATMEALEEIEKYVAQTYSQILAIKERVNTPWYTRLWAWMKGLF